MSTAPCSALIRWTAAGLYHSRLMFPLSRAIALAARPPAFQILTFHRINDDHDPFFPSLPTGVFEQRMAYLAETCRVLTVEQLVKRARAGNLPANAVAITFDDGYRDNLTHAAPILARLGLPATIFLATGFIGTTDVAWSDRLAMAFKLTTRESLLTPWRKVASLSSQAERLRTLAETIAFLKQQPEDQLRVTVDCLLETLGVTDQNRFKDLMLNWDDVNALVGLGFSIGAHTVTHPILSRVSAQQARTEIVASRRVIELACHQTPTSFAYPNGTARDYTQTVTHLVREAGFTSAVTTRFGLNTASTSPFELRRGGPWEEDLPTFALKLAGYRLLGARANFS